MLCCRNKQRIYSVSCSKIIDYNQENEFLLYSSENDFDIIDIDIKRLNIYATKTQLNDFMSDYECLTDYKNQRFSGNEISKNNLWNTKQNSLTYSFINRNMYERY